VDILGAADPHATIVWAGMLNEVEPYVVPELRSLVQFSSRFHQPFSAMVVGTDVFGQNEEQTHVLRIEAPQLYFLRNLFQQYNGSEYPFSPHVSVPSPPVKWPETILFKRIALWLGDGRVEPTERITYELGSGAPCES
jgi:hypothetical protein